MIKRLSIKNFKSIKELELNCKKVNIFIGEPNTGKSNILEVLGFISWLGFNKKDSNGFTNLKQFIRFQNVSDLFYDQILEHPIEITYEDNKSKYGVTIHPKVDKTSLMTIFEVNHSSFRKNKTDKRFWGSLDYQGTVFNPFIKDIADARIKALQTPTLQGIKLYRFSDLGKFSNTQSTFLSPPDGDNLFSLVISNLKHRETMKTFFKNYGLKLVLRQMEKQFEFQKTKDDIEILLPYIAASDTLKRIIFHSIAIDSNKNSILVFEEPEVHSFPCYTKYLGEKIAFDEVNQYFIVTHNPYLLLSILEKTPKEYLSVFVIHYKSHQTKVRCLNTEETSELMVYDPFFNLDQFVIR